MREDRSESAIERDLEDVGRLGWRDFAILFLASAGLIGLATLAVWLVVNARTI